MGEAKYNSLSLDEETFREVFTRGRENLDIVQLSRQNQITDFRMWI
jgi:hypothetical protein